MDTALYPKVWNATFRELPAFVRPYTFSILLHYAGQSALWNLGHVSLWFLLSAGETTYSLEHASDLRVEVQKVYELIDALR